MRANDHTYDDCLDIVAGEVKRHHHKHGGDPDELLSEANLVFAHVYERWQRGSTVTSPLAFGAWLRIKIHYRLLELARRIATRRKHFESADLRQVCDTRSSRFKLTDLLEDLSPDAQVVVLLAVDPPADVRLTAAMSRGIGSPASLRLGIKRMLCDLGWATEDITATFDEVAQALNGRHQQTERANGRHKRHQRLQRRFQKQMRQLHQS